jgi:hypothetical protein
MKKTYYLLLFVLLASFTVNAQTGWVTKNIDDKLSIKFPVEPKKATKNGFDSYVAKGNDSVAYSSTVLDLKVVANLDSATLAPVKDSQEFADQMKMGMVSTKTNYTIGDITIGKWKNYTTYSVSGTENATKSTLYIRMILIGSKMYTLSCMLPANLSTKNNETFFGSVDFVTK